MTEAIERWTKELIPLTEEEFFRHRNIQIKEEKKDRLPEPELRSQLEKEAEEDEEGLEKKLDESEEIKNIYMAAPLIDESTPSINQLIESRLNQNAGRRYKFEKEIKLYPGFVGYRTVGQNYRNVTPLRAIMSRLQYEMPVTKKVK